MSLRQCELVKLWGLTKGRVSQMVKAGMPLESVQAAEAWRMANCGWHGGIAKISPSSDGGGGAEVLPEPPPAPAAAMLDRADLHGVGARLVEAELQSWRELYAERCRKFPDNDRVLALTKVWRESMQARMAAEKQLLEIRVREGVLVTSESARGVIRDALGPLIRRVQDLCRTMPVRCNPTNPDMAKRELLDWSQQTLRIAQAAAGRDVSVRRKGAAAAARPVIASEPPAVEVAP